MRGFISLLLAMALTAVPAHAKIKLKSKNDGTKAPEVDLVTWARDSAATLPATVEDVRMYRPAALDADGQPIYTATVGMSGKAARQAMIAAIDYLQDTMNTDTDAIESVDWNKCTFSLFRSAKEGEGKNAVSVEYSTDFKFADGTMSFTARDIEVLFKERGFLPRRVRMDHFRPASNASHKPLVENVSLAHSRMIQGIAERAAAHPKYQVTHWDDIARGRVAKGMTRDEVKLIGGRPLDISGPDKREQWFFNNNFIVIFNNGAVSSMIQP